VVGRTDQRAGAPRDWPNLRPSASGRHGPAYDEPMAAKSGYRDASCAASSARRMKRHEGVMEADEPAPEGSPCPSVD
jgi:hypothetical protein